MEWVGFSNLDSNRVTTEDMWTDEEQEGLSIYEKSKLQAEKRAWKFIAENKPSYEFTIVNAVAIWGPQLNEHTTGSFNLINGKAPMLPDMPLI